MKTFLKSFLAEFVTAFFAVIIIMMFFSNCVKKKVTEETPIKDEITLFSRLGGKDGIVGIATDFISKVEVDPTIGASFKATVSTIERRTAFRDRLVDQFCAISNGPCTYTGKSMTVAHAGMNISENEFAQFQVLLKAAIESRNIEENAKNELLDSLFKLKEVIVVPLYVRIGGQEMVAKIVDQFIAYIKADNDTMVSNPFKATRANPQGFTAFRNKMIDFICAQSGGKCTYSGKLMTDAHKGMKITSQGFNGFIKDFQLALDHFNIPKKEKDDLIERIFKPLAVDIVGK